MKKKLSMILALAMVLTMALTACGNGDSDGGDPQYLRLATGGDTGTYYAVGSAMATTLNPLLDGLSLNISSTGASKDNVQGITDDQYDLAIVQSDVVTYAHAGNNGFTAPETDALWVAGLYNETVQITAVSGITSVEQLRGKTVCVGDAGSGTEFNAIQILSAYGMTFDDINVVHGSFAEGVEQLKQGQIDAAFTVAGAPTTAIVDLASSGTEFSMVSLTQDAVDYLTANYPFLVQENLPANTYSGIDTETVCVAVQAVLVASKDLSEDTVYQLTKAMFENLDDLTTGHPKFGLVTVQTAISDAIPMHPGAEKYYKEIGAL